MILIISTIIVLLAGAGLTTSCTHVDFSATICEFKMSGGLMDKRNNQQII